MTAIFSWGRMTSTGHFEALTQLGTLRRRRLSAASSNLVFKITKKVANFRIMPRAKCFFLGFFKLIPPVVSGFWQLRCLSTSAYFQLHSMLQISVGNHVQSIGLFCRVLYVEVKQAVFKHLLNMKLQSKCFCCKRKMLPEILYSLTIENVTTIAL